MTDRIPARDEFATPDEILVEVHGEPDNFDRTPFAAYWLTDQEWVPGGVQAQLFQTSLRWFTGRAEMLGQTVRVLP